MYILIEKMNISGFLAYHVKLWEEFGYIMFPKAIFIYKFVKNFFFFFFGKMFKPLPKYS
jgi:hypothetical protein